MLLVVLVQSQQSSGVRVTELENRVRTLADHLLRSQSAVDKATSGCALVYGGLRQMRMAHVCVYFGVQSVQRCSCSWTVRRNGVRWVLDCVNEVTMSGSS